jgi:probable rRNA maturation factor
MAEQSIYYFTEGIDVELDENIKNTTTIIQVAEKEGVGIGVLNFIFCSDDYLLEMNKFFLAHDFYTDIITFEHSQEDSIISGDVFISADRARANAFEFKVSFAEEIKRLIIHGILHLVGYNDGAAEEKLTMRKKEDYYLSLWPG